jgi:CxxC motif-containing protein
MNERKLTCIVCPKGCDLTVEFDEQGVIKNITGYTCPRGKDYAYAECTAPVRTVTTTVRCADGYVVPVKTNAPIPKEKIFDVMKAINSVVAPNTIRIGDVIISDVCGTGSDVVATAEKNA